MQSMVEVSRSDEWDKSSALCITVGQDHHFNVVDAIVLEIGYDARASLTRAAVDQDVRVVGSVQQDTISLAHVDVRNLERIL